MQHSKASITELFSQSRQYLIPIFQRGYVWTLEDQVKPLWEDIASRAEALADHRTNKEKVGVQKLRPLQKHFLGTIVLSGQQSATFGQVPTVEVIDGQQRITTLQILLLAFRDVAKTLGDDFVANTFESYTRNQGAYRNKEHHFKVWPTNAGRAEIEGLASLGSVEAVCDRFPIRRDGKKLSRPLMVEAYLYFYGMITLYLRDKNFDDPWEEAENGRSEKNLSDQVIHSIRHDGLLCIPHSQVCSDKTRAELLLDTLSQAFQLMALDLDVEDDPQVIFETLNARGALLFPSDLIRNYLFLQATRKEEDVDELYNDHWRTFDEKPANGGNPKGEKFWKKEERQGRLKNTRLDLLLFHYVGLRTQEEIKVTHVFQGFKSWWESQSRNTKAELARLCSASEVFEEVIEPKPNSRFGQFCSRVKTLDTAMLTPTILYLREHHEADSPEFTCALDDLESYLVRRYVCGLTTKGYNRIFLKLLADLVSGGRTDALSIRKALLALKGDSQIWPDDDTFRSAWLSRPLYQSLRAGKTRMLLEALELAQRTSKQENVPLPGGLTIEHVMPQAWEPDEWPIADPAETGKVIRNQLLHTIGNLTLVTQPLNSALSRGPFKNKRPEITKSLLMLNSYFQRDEFCSATAVWNEEIIMKRSSELFIVAKNVWPRRSSELEASR